MSTLVTDAQAKSVRFDADTMWVDLEDGRQLDVPLAYFPRLLNATPAQRESLTISGGGKGLQGCRWINYLDLQRFLEERCF
jgi:hypothetical protein